MAEFRDITIIKEANIYFDGKVTSRSLVLLDGSRKTLGIMLPGEYDFNTDDKEIIEIISGDLEVLLPETESWKRFSAGESFEVPAQSKFGLRVKNITDYCCSFVD
ncbi:MAG: pyrimidine/purine nucleoside phosphorylase [Anaerolineales bacterium]|nr:pyrimidine/purine nucleoside phosphorylase [Anaerolineales bacterium]